MNNSPKHFDDESITRNRKSCGAPPINCRGSGDGGNSGCGGGCGGGGGHGCGLGRNSNYRKVNFSSPVNNEEVCVVNGKAYAACKNC